MSRREEENIKLRSEEVQEVLGTPPSWLTQYGTLMALMTFVAIAWAAYWMEYPDSVTGPVTITSSDPPVRLVAQKNNYIDRVLIQNEDTVVAGQVLIVMRNYAEFSDVLYLDDLITAVDTLTDSTLMAFRPPRNLILGNLQDPFYQFTRSQEQFEITYSGKYEKLDIRELRKQKNILRQGIEVEEARKGNLDEKIDLAYQRFNNQEDLYKSGRIPFREMQDTREELLSLQREQQSVESSIKSKEFQIENIDKQISGLQRDSREYQSYASSEMETNFIKLKNQLAEWKEENLIVSPILGVASFTSDEVFKDKYVIEDKQLIIVFPLDNQEPEGRVLLEPGGIGKVQPGQEVVIKLESYPFPEFGAVRGKVVRKSAVPSGKSIPVIVTFPDGFVTTRGKTISLGKQMQGQAEIITLDKRFIERVFERFRKYGAG